MIDAGDIHFADLNEERRCRVFVISNARFQGVSGRVLVAPEIIGAPGEVPFPWRVQVDEAVYAVDLVRSLPAAHLLERADRGLRRRNGPRSPGTAQHHLTGIATDRPPDRWAIQTSSAGHRVAQSPVTIS
jgi:hypothetical protein